MVRQPEVVVVRPKDLPAKLHEGVEIRVADINADWSDGVGLWGQGGHHVTGVTEVLIGRDAVGLRVNDIERRRRIQQRFKVAGTLLNLQLQRPLAGMHGNGKDNLAVGPARDILVPRAVGRWDS